MWKTVDVAADHKELEQEMLWENRKIVLREAIDSLPEKQQEIIRLYF